MNRNALNRYFYSLLKKVGAGDEQKAAMLEGYGVKSTSELSDRQLAELCAALEKDADPPKTLRRKRSKVLELLTLMGVYHAGGSWAPVNRYLEQPRIAGKRLYELDEKELNTLIAKLHLLRKKQVEKQNEIDTKARDN